MPVTRFPVSCRLSAIGLRFLGHPAPAGELSLPHGRPTGGQPTGPQRGCRVAHEQDPTGQGAPFTPGTAVRSRPATILRPAPAAFQRPVPTAPLEHPIGGGHLHEASSGVHSRSPITPTRLAAAPGREAHRFPPVFSSPAAPGWNESRFGFYPGLRTPQSPATHAEAETGHRALARVLHLRHQPNLQRCLPLHSCTLTSHVVAGRLQRDNHHRPGGRPIPQPSNRVGGGRGSKRCHDKTGLPGYHAPNLPSPGARERKSFCKGSDRSHHRGPGSKYSFDESASSYSRRFPLSTLRAGL